MALSYHEGKEENRRTLSYGSNEGLNGAYKLKQHTMEKNNASKQSLNNFLTALPSAAVGETKLG